MTETQFINLWLILTKHGESSYQAQLKHQSRPDPQPVTFNFALTDKISGNNDFSYYFKRLGELKAREEDLDIVGKALYNLVFREDLGSKFEAWYQALTQGERFRLRLDIQAPELISVPWELLRDDKQFLVRRGVSIARFIGNASKEDVNLDFKKMKVLIVSASPNNNSFDENEYIEPVKTLFEKYGIQLDILTGENATRQGLYEILGENKYDLFHFVGHGTFAKDNGKVIVINQQGNSASIRGNDLSDWLCKSGVKFAFFCSCQTGITSQENTFNGVAYSLVGTGIPTVVAMQYNFPQEEAKTFVKSFYNKLLRSESIDQSMEFARNALPYEEVSWCIPVLYSQSQFNITGLVTQPISEEKITKQDIQQLANLLGKSGFCALDQREVLCLDIGVEANKLNFFNNSNNSTFARLLINYLFEVDRKSSLKLICESLEAVFEEGKNVEILRTIKVKLL
ncbi:MAG: CHAT domain-containing protein [Nostoc sp.]|uniref:CHAT domain-containing protein n=1 Tax=Nostoc sp. TaxID=1180 RepID=UPI002FF12AAF